MRTATAGTSAGVRQISVGAPGSILSGLLAEPSGQRPRATVVALHGGGMRAGYFDGQAHPDLSLMTLAADLGFTVLALDRPGYGTSAARLPKGETLAEQAVSVLAALESFAERRPTGAGFLLLGHSYGGKLALSTAAQDSCGGVVGVDVSGCGAEYAVAHEELPDPSSAGSWKHNWGALRLYPDGTFTSSRSLVSDRPERECGEALGWPGAFPGIASRVRVPTRLTFAEYEYWWRHDEAALSRMARAFTRCTMRFASHPGAGHNISLGWAARSYHLTALGFLEECLALRTSGRRPNARRRVPAVP